MCILLLLGNAVYRITPIAVEPWLDGSMTPIQKGLFVLFALFNAYAEGYRGFQLRFSPRVVSRAVYLGQNPRPLWVLLALPFCMGLFHSTRKKVAWILLIVITGLVIAVKQIPQPWRGIIDGGVVVGLGWGMLSTFVQLIGALRGNAPAPVDLPEAESAANVGELDQAQAS